MSIKTLPDLVKEWARLEPSAVTYRSGNAVLHYSDRNPEVFIGPFPFGPNPDYERWAAGSLLPHIVWAFERRAWHYEVRVMDAPGDGITEYEAVSTTGRFIKDWRSGPTITEAMLNCYVARLSKHLVQQGGALRSGKGSHE